MINTGKLAAKKALRTELTARLKAIEPAKKTAMNIEILKRLQEISDLQSARHVFCFVSTGDEIDTQAVINWLIQEQKQVSVPKISEEGMAAIQFTDWSMMQANQYGILEPVEWNTIDADINVCIAPGIGFSVDGGRLGMGLGYYDMWFSQHPGTLRVATAYEIQIVTDLPVEAHDVGIDIIVTEERIIRV